MKSSPTGIPRWVWLGAGFIFLAQAVAVILRAADALEGPARNLVPQVLIGGLGGLLLLAIFLLVRHADSLRPPSLRLAIAALSLFALALTGLHFMRARPYLMLPYDLACWSEPMFLLDIVKMRTHTSLYLPPDDSNSNVYPPAAPVVTYFVAWLLGHPTSIILYRWIQQLYLLLTALLAALSAWNLLRIGSGERQPPPTRFWLLLFAVMSFLLAVNPQTNAFNIYLHNDPLSLLISTFAFWLLTQYARTKKSVWLLAMLPVPAIGFMVKQYLAIWAVAYLVYLALAEEVPWRRVVGMGAVFLGGGMAVLLGGRLLWGENFRYWAFEVMGSHILSFEQISERYADASGYILLGILGGLGLARNPSERRPLSLWFGWVVLVLAAVYTSGVTFRPSHFGPATIVGGCFALAALARLAEEQEYNRESPATQWYQVMLGIGLVATALVGFGFARIPEGRPSKDVLRYVTEIEREFEGLPRERVLLDLGEWSYLKSGVLMKDRASSLLTHRTPHFGLLDRVRRQEYDRILVHEYRKNELFYDIGGERGIRETLFAYYREVRRIPAVKDARWEYAWMTLGEIVVLEPIPGKANAKLSDDRFPNSKEERRFASLEAFNH